VGLETIFVELQAAADLLGEAGGLSKTATTSFDASLDALKSAIEKESPLVAVGSIAITIVALDLLPAELLAAGVMATIDGAATVVAGEGALASATAALDAMIAQDAPALFSIASGSEIVVQSSAFIGKIGAGATVSQVAPWILSGIKTLSSSPYTVSIGTQSASSARDNPGVAAVFTPTTNGGLTEVGSFGGDETATYLNQSANLSGILQYTQSSIARSDNGTTATIISTGNSDLAPHVETGKNEGTGSVVTFEDGSGRTHTATILYQQKDGHYVIDGATETNSSITIAKPLILDDSVTILNIAPDAQLALTKVVFQKLSYEYQLLDTMG
jgi:hypothetical protein